MKKLHSAFIFLFFSFTVSAQIGFQEHNIINNSFSSTGLESIAYADLDGDGDHDILAVSANFPSSAPYEDKVGWYENLDGKGNFGRLKVITNEADGPRSVHAVDIDGDNDLDVVSASYDDNTIAWYENTDGGGNFSSLKIIAANVRGARFIRAGDFDGDGDQDLVSASSIDDTIAWYENLDGLGNFGGKKIISNTADSARSVHVEDIDNDLDLDIVSTSFKDGKLIWHKNIDGKGNFEESIIELGLDGPSFAITGDVDGDGDNDVVSVLNREGAIIWYENLDGLGSFGPRKNIRTSLSYPDTASLEDLDQDGDLDIIYTSGWNENLDGKGNFGLPKWQNNDSYVLTADIDGDTRPEVIFGDGLGKIAWLDYLNADKTFGNEHIISEMLSVPDIVFTIDLDGDADDDILVKSGGYNQITWYENQDGSGTFGKQKNIVIDDAYYTIFPADVDGDDDMDILFGGPENLGWYENTDGKGKFSDEPKFTTEKTLRGSNWASSIYGADIDGDDDIDLVYGSQSEHKVAWFENLDGKGSFGSEQIITLETTVVRSINVADIDNDGDQDVLSASWSDDKIAWYENVDGNGTFGNQQIITQDTDRPTYVTTGDLDNDGDIDVISGSLGDNKIAWYENLDGKGTFGSQKILNALTKTPGRIATADIDKDGDLDVFASEQIGNTLEKTLSWYENTNGDGVFGAEQIIETDARNTAGIDFGDIDNDGSLDIVASFSAYGGLSWLENLSLVSNEINGIVKYDPINEGCTNGSVPASGFLITTDNGNERTTTSTLSNGSYQFFVGAGSYRNTVSNLPSYFSFSPSNSISEFNGTGNTDSVDFCIVPNEVVNDLNVVLIPTSESRAGFETTYDLVFGNIGTTEMSGTINLEHEYNLLFLTSSKAPDSQNRNSLSFSFENLKPFEKRTILLTFKIPPPPSVNLGDILTFNTTISPNAGDHTPLDNIHELNQEVIGSYDPNDIRVLEGDSVLVEDADQYLNYVIRFQNTGTASAINVRIDHELDADLDWETFTPIASSHTNATSITNGKDVEFLFENINLPDSTSNEPASHGHVAFKIKPKTGITIGDVIKGKAGIFFDFNPPIITNEVTTEIVEEFTEPLEAYGVITSEISCAGNIDASVQIDAFGGVPPYEYELFDENSNTVFPQTSQNTFDGLYSGDYTAVVYDSNNDFADTFVTILDPEPLVSEIQTTNVSATGVSDGSIEVIGVSGGTPPYQYQIDTNGYQNANVFNNLAIGSYELTVLDTNSCFVTEQVTISDPDAGSSFSLPTTNFTVKTTSESCASSNNGSLLITAMENLEYSVTLSGNSVTETKSFRTEVGFQNLEAGIYQACITVMQHPEYEKCFSVTITEPEALRVTSKVDASGKSVSLKMKGGTMYSVKLNGKVYNTSQNEITLPLSNPQNDLSVETEAGCQGLHRETILLTPDVSVFPNPVEKGYLTVILENGTSATVQSILATSKGAILFQKNQKPVNGTLKIDMDAFPSGVYLLRIKTENGVYVRKIIKK